MLWVESNTAALIGSVCVDVKGEISHATLNMMIKIKRLQLSHRQFIFDEKDKKLTFINFNCLGTLLFLLLLAIISLILLEVV